MLTVIERYPGIKQKGIKAKLMSLHFTDLQDFKTVCWEKKTKNKKLLPLSLQYHGGEPGPHTCYVNILTLNDILNLEEELTTFIPANICPLATTIIS